MADNGVVDKLVRNKGKLILQKRNLDLEYKEKINVIQKQIDDIDKAIKIINDALGPYLCPKCKGTGVKRICDCAGDMDDEICPDCKGTGIKII